MVTLHTAHTGAFFRKAFSLKLCGSAFLGLLVARLLSLLPRALSSLSTGLLDFMVSGWPGCWPWGLNNAGAWPGGFLEAAWRRQPLPLGGGQAVWLV